MAAETMTKQVLPGMCSDRRTSVGCYGRVSVIVFAVMLVLLCFFAVVHGTLAVDLAASGVAIIVYAAVFMLFSLFAAAYGALAVGDPAAGMTVIGFAVMPVSFSLFASGHGALAVGAA